VTAVSTGVSAANTAATEVTAGAGIGAVETGAVTGGNTGAAAIAVNIAAVNVNPTVVVNASLIGAANALPSAARNKPLNATKTRLLPFNRRLSLLNPCRPRRAFNGAPCCFIGIASSCPPYSLVDTDSQ
jgi:hypothetical protein